jgi:hypothetical protein
MLPASGDKYKNTEMKNGVSDSSDAKVSMGGDPPAKAGCLDGFADRMNGALMVGPNTHTAPLQLDCQPS